MPNVRNSSSRARAASHSSSTKPKKRTTKRGKGRPTSLDNGVGRQKLIDVARELLRSTPPSDLTSGQVARAADGDRALVRYYFGTLPNLLAEVAGQLSVGLIDQLAQASEGPGTARERLRRRIRTFVRYELENPALHPLYTERILNRKSGPSRQTVNQIAAQGHESFRRILADGRRDGEFRKDFDIRLLEIAIIGLAEFIVVGRPILEAWLSGDEEIGDLLDQYGSFVADLVVRAISTA